MSAWAATRDTIAGKTSSSIANKSGAHSSKMDVPGLDRYGISTSKGIGGMFKRKMYAQTASAISTLRRT
jgi:hypothetical protein